MSQYDNHTDDLLGRPSDEVPEILGIGRTDITAIFTSLSMRHPEGEDAAYLRWHTLDHRPEQYRLASIRAAVRIASTPACRSARAASIGQFDATDHVMTYFFADIGGLREFGELALALQNAGRMAMRIPSVQQRVSLVDDRVSVARAKVGSDVLPWWAARGIYLLIEESADTPSELTDVPGVAGLWSGTSKATEFTDAEAGQKISYLFLDADPVETAEQLKPVLKKRWETSGIRPLLAAPFYTIVPYDWGRYLP